MYTNQEFTFRALGYKPTRAIRAFVEEFSLAHYDERVARVAALIRQAVEEMTNTESFVVNYAAWTSPNDDQPSDEQFNNHLKESYIVKTNLGVAVFSLSLSSKWMSDTFLTPMAANECMVLPSFTHESSEGFGITSNQLQHHFLNLQRALSNHGTFKQGVFDTKAGVRQVLCFEERAEILQMTLSVALPQDPS